MRLLTLNLWGGQVYDPLLSFLKNHAGDIDLFCFQEMLFGDEPDFTPVHKARINLFTEIQRCLPSFTAVTYPAPVEARYFQSEKLPADTRAGQAIFVRNSLSIIDQGTFRTYKDMPANTDYGGKITGSCQWVEIQKSDQTALIASLHGLWQRDSNKVDTPERLEQSRLLAQFMERKQGGRLLCGDFNLRPDTESMNILTKQLRNLVTETGVTSTRSALYDKPGMKFADYILVSPEVTVKKFQVLSDVVSDHLPLFLEFS